jgi:glycosyltransferase involved in cell wall biosynthesis
MEQNGQANSPKIAYVIKCFPRLSETFILHEVLELERQGLPLRIFSLLKPTGKVNQAAQRVQAPVTYLPQGFFFRWLSLLAAATRRFVKNPFSFLAISVTALVRFHHPATLKHLLYAAYLSNQLERERITHLHAHYANTPATVALLAHQFTGIPFSFTAHAKDIYLSHRPTLAYKMKQARFTVTCTGYNQQYLASLAGPHDAVAVHRIYHGLDLSVFPAHTSGVSTPRARPLILTVARLVEKKGLRYLLQACRRLQDQGYDFTCRIVGEGPLRANLAQQIRDLGLSARVELWGADTHEHVIEMYRQATLFALPAVVAENGDRDGIPNVLVESLYMGVPVVSTPVSGIPELLSSERNGLLVPERDSAALAATIARLLDDPRLRERLATAGRQTVLARFDMASNTQRLMQLFLNSEDAPVLVAEDAARTPVPAGILPVPAMITKSQPLRTLLPTPRD